MTIITCFISRVEIKLTTIAACIITLELIIILLTQGEAGHSQPVYDQGRDRIMYIN